MRNGQQSAHRRKFWLRGSETSPAAAAERFVVPPSGGFGCAPNWNEAVDGATEAQRTQRGEEIATTRHRVVGHSCVAALLGELCASVVSIAPSQPGNCEVNPPPLRILARNILFLFPVPPSDSPTS